MAQLSFNQFIKGAQQAQRRLLKDLNNILLKSALRMERDAKKNATSFPKVRTGTLYPPASPVFGQGSYARTG